MTRNASQAAAPESKPTKVAALEKRIRELEEVLSAIRRGDVDALVAEGDAIVPLAGADELYRLTVETMLEGALTLSAEGLILYCNARFAELINRPAADLIGQPLATFLAEPDRSQLRALCEGATAATTRGHLTLISADGSRRHVMLSLRDLPNDASDHLLAVVTDVTDVLRAEEAKLQLARIVDSARDAIIGNTLDGIVTSWNRGAERLYGYSADEMIGRHIDVLGPAERRDEIDGLMRQVQEGETVHGYETQRIAK